MHLGQARKAPLIPTPPEARRTLVHRLGNISRLGAGSTIDIGTGVLHRIHNVGQTDVVFIEVQTGTYFGEDDIERVEDDFGR
ncbi:MAG: hypothetical protein RL421_1123 [Actinomycetota bacterium]